MTESEAMLRVALLVAHADGHESEEEMVATAEVLGTRLISPTVAKVQRWRASHDVATVPAKDLLKQVRKVLAKPEDRVKAFKVACEVAKADKRLSWNETQQMVEVAKALGLKTAQVQQIAAAYWR